SPAIEFGLGRETVTPIKSRIGVRGISRCTTKALHARFAKQLPQLMTRVEHSRLDGVCRDGNDLGYLFDRFVLVIADIRHFTFTIVNHRCPPPINFFVIKEKITFSKSTISFPPRHNDWTY